MSSLFDEIFTDAAALSIQHYGRTVAYAFANGEAAASVTAIVGPVAEELLEVGRERTAFRHRTIQFLASEVPEPRHGERIDLAQGNAEADIWTVEERLPARGGFVRVLAIQPVRVEGGGRRSGRRE